MLKFNKLDERPSNWDELIKNYDTKTLFHSSHWLEHVLSIHPEGKIEYFEICDGEEVVGFHCGLRIKKMGIPIHGTPLGGTGTNYQGPIVNKSIDQDKLISGLLKLFGPKRFMHLELSHYWLEEKTMKKKGFTAYPNVTHLIKLPDDEKAAWDSLKGAARNRIRKAEDNSLTVEQATDISIAKEFYAQFVEVYGKQNMATPFGEERPLSLFQNLFEAGLLLPLIVKHKDEIIATGLFPYDENCIYFWGATSWLKYQKLCPNEILHWHVIKNAIEKKIPAYNMCGGNNQFKNKFGGNDVPYIHYSKSALPFMQVARNIFKKMHFRALKK